MNQIINVSYLAWIEASRPVSKTLGVCVFAYNQMFEAKNTQCLHLNLEQYVGKTIPYKKHYRYELDLQSYGTESCQLRCRSVELLLATNL